MQENASVIQLGVKIPALTYPVITKWCERHYMSVADALRQGLAMLMDSDPTLSRAEAANAAIVADPPFRAYRKRVNLIIPPDRAVFLGGKPLLLDTIETTVQNRKNAKKNG